MEIDKIKKIRQIKAFSLLFTEKQMVILKKMINTEKLNKQENEVYSRILKPKINAIIDLYEIALLIRDKV